MNDSGKGKGFEGLSGLSSRPKGVAPRQEAGSAPATKATPSQQNDQSSARSTQTPTPAQPQKPISQTNLAIGAVKRVAAVVAGLVVLIVVASHVGSSDEPNHDPANYNATAPTPVTGTSSDSTPSVSAYTPPTRPTEEVPPVGQNLIFNDGEIRYCLAEEIRLNAAKAAVNQYSDAQVDRFNAMVGDYNGRCASYRYSSGALEQARSDIEPWRAQIEEEGRGQVSAQ